MVTLRSGYVHEGDRKAKKAKKSRKVKQIPFCFVHIIFNDNIFEYKRIQLNELFNPSISRQAHLDALTLKICLESRDSPLSESTGVYLY